MVALEKSKKLYKIYECLSSFYFGFSKHNPDRNDETQKAYVEKWFEDHTVKWLEKTPRSYEEDAHALAKIILERRDMGSNRR